MSGESGSRSKTPVGIILICALLVLYAFLWFVTWLVAGTIGNGVIAVVSVPVSVAVLLLAYLLYHGNRTAWWIVLIFIGGSTLWRLALVVGGKPENLMNAIVGVALVLYLLSQYEFFHPRQA